MNNPADQLESETELESIEAHPVGNGDGKIVATRSGSGCAKILVFVVLFLLLVAAATWYAITEAQRVPEFYAQVLHADHPQAKFDGQQFERNLIRLQNSARQRKPWKVEISQDQVNGWLANDLPTKFPDSIPREILEPRAVFAQDELKLAFRYNGNGIEGIIVVTANVFCTDKPNEIAVEVKDVRAGMIPLPTGPWIEKVAESFRKAGIPLFWTTAADSPVAVFSIPEYLSAKGNNQQVVIEAIELSPKKLVIAGKTEEFVPAAGPNPSLKGPNGQKSPNAKKEGSQANENSRANIAKAPGNGRQATRDRKKSDSRQENSKSNE